MSFLGKVRSLDSSPTETRGLRGDIASQFQGQLPGVVQGAFGLPKGDMQFFLNNLLKPYSELFSTQRAGALAQAKESAGNLTGTGYNNILGSAAASSIASEQSILANLLTNLRGQEIQRNNDLLGMILGFSASGFPRQNAYQPGFLDYAGPIAGTALGSWLAPGAAGAVVGGAAGSAATKQGS